MKQLFCTAIVSILWGLAPTLAHAQPARQIHRQVGIVEEFEAGMNGWLPGFTDYRLGQAGTTRRAEVRRLPDNLDSEKRALYLQSGNDSSNTFMFVKKALGPEHGVHPNGVYRADFLVDMASNASADCFGIGGSPADVYLKVGVSPVEPIAVLRDSDVMLNLDKGAASDDGAHASTVTTIDNLEPCRTPQPYKRAQEYQGFPRHVQADAEGQIWVFVGFDSSYTGVTGIYLNRIIVLLSLIR